MSKPNKRRSSSLLKRKRTITQDATYTKRATSLKPQKTRQLIRRFHTLQKNKSGIYRILGQRWHETITDSNYLILIETDSLLHSHYERSRQATLAAIKLNQPLSIVFHETDSEKHLVSLLGQIDAEIEKRGGLETYQTASTLGQNRGGDSSKKLMEWLAEIPKQKDISPTALEIGSLSSRNAISTSGYFASVTRIDLRSQEPSLILEQDFMERELPKNEDEKFDLISCSLVVNFVPTASERGEMLKRITRFLKEPQGTKSMLFLVLPLPCVSNSRYFDHERLEKIMVSLGFQKIKYHEANKIAYWLWEWNGIVFKKKFSKAELHSGSKRNNFCIVLE